MLTTRPTQKQVKEWKTLYEEQRETLAPNRVSGEELDEYFRSRYEAALMENEDFRLLVETTILCTEYYKAKLPEGTKPNVKCYRVKNALVGVDLASAYFHVESADFAEMEKIYDDLFLFRGLDEADLKNFFLTAQYLLLK